MRKILLLLFVGSLPLFAKPVIVFDYGGVAAQRSSVALTKVLQEDLLLNTFQENYVRNAIESNFGLPGSDEELVFIKQVALSKNISISNDWLKRYKRIRTQIAVLTPEVMQVVHKLQELNYKTVLLSNITELYADAIRGYGHYNLFDQVFLSYELGVEKPEPEVFTKTAELLGVSPHECIFFDDSSTNISGALSAQFDAVLFINVDQMKSFLEDRLDGLHL